MLKLRIGADNEDQNGQPMTLNMHELAVCQALLQEVTKVARANNALEVTGIRVLLGPLSGVEGQLLARAFEFARQGTVAASAELTIEVDPVRILCHDCGATSEVVPSHLRCPECNAPFPTLLSGDAMTLASVAIERETCEHRSEETSYV